MYKVHYLNKISENGTALWTEDYALGANAEEADAMLVRSASMHDMEMPNNLLAIASAGAGVNNIPLTSCADQGIVVFNTPGANANSVMELALCGMLLACRDIVGGINWVQTIKGSSDVARLVEKGKSQFAGHEIREKSLGVIGLGAIGVLVANAATHLGMTVYGYDPYLSVESAWNLSRSVIHAKDLKEIYANCDYITIHVPLTPDTKNTVCEETIAQMKDGVRILNFARAALVNDQDIIKALESGKVASYVTDFPTDDVIGCEGVIAIPHLGASTPESEDNCATMASKQLIDYIENGNIKNSVNLPNLDMPRSGKTRICVIHKNIPGVISAITTKASAHNINIENLSNKSKKDMAYTVLDINSDDAGFVADLESEEGIIRVRVI